MARYDDLNTNMIAYATVLSIVVLVLVLQGTQALTYNMIKVEDDKKISRSEDLPLQAKKAQLATLEGYKKARILDEASDKPDATKEVFLIPISEAKKLVVAEFGAKP